MKRTITSRLQRRASTTRASWMVAVLLIFLAAAIPAHAADNTIYGVTHTGSLNIYTIDPATGAAVSVDTLLFSSAAIARHPTSGLIYYTARSLNAQNRYSVATWNPATLADATLSTNQLTVYLPRLAFNSNGTLYGMDTNNNLYTISTANGQILTTTAIGCTGTCGGWTTGLGGDMAFAPDGTLYVVAGVNLFRINGSVASLVGNTGITAVPAGLAFGEGGVLYASNTNGGAGLSRIFTLNTTSGAGTPVGPPGGGYSGAELSDLASMPKFADLSITKTATGAFVAGSTATYTLSVANAGPSNASPDITITDTLPAGVSYSSFVGASWTCGAAGQVVTCRRNTALNSGANSSLTLTVLLAANVSATIVNSASVSSTTFDHNLANNTESETTAVVQLRGGLAITPDAGTRQSVVAGQATALFNFSVTNTGNLTDQVRFLANGASARVTGPAIITDIVIDTDGSQTISAPDTDIKNNAADVLSAPLAPNGSINVIVRILVDLTAVQGDSITVTLGDAATGGPTFDDQAADSSANEVRTVSTAPANGLREARGDRTALVDNDAQIFLEMTAPTGPVPLGSDITYTLQLSNPGLRDLTGETLTNAPAGSDTGVFIIAPIPVGTVLKSGQVFPAGTLYTISALSIDPLTAVWTTTPPADLTTLKRIAFNIGPTLTAGASVTGINLTVTITTNDATNPIQEITDAFGRNSINAPLTDQSGDISRTSGDGNANFDEGPLRGTIDGNGIIQLTTLQAVGSVLLGPAGQPGAVGPTNNNDDFTNKNVSADAIAGVPPGGGTNEPSTIDFVNTVRNTGNANDIFTLTAPTVPAGFTVEISTDGGTSFTTVSGGGSTTLAVNFGQDADIIVRITAPANTPVLNAFETIIRATSANSAASTNDTINRLYTGFLRLDKTATVTNGTGVGGATDAVSGAVIEYTITFNNVGGNPASQLIISDKIPAETEFKLGSVNYNPGTTGLAAPVVEYTTQTRIAGTEDPPSPWINYTPAGAPGSFDPQITYVRFLFSGNLPPNTSGTISFTVRIL